MILWLIDRATAKGLISGGNFSQVGDFDPPARLILASGFAELKREPTRSSRSFDRLLIEPLIGDANIAGWKKTMIGVMKEQKV